MTETQFKEKVEKWLTDNHAWFIKYWAGAKFTKEGIPDVLACINGRFYGIELKKTGGKPTVLQLLNLKKIREAGGIGVLLYPEDLDYFESFVLGTPIGEHWYRENKEKQKKLFEKMTL